VTGDTVAEAAQGPPGPGQNNLYQVYPFYAGTDSACTNAIFLLPPSFKYGTAFNWPVPTSGPWNGPALEPASAAPPPLYPAPVYTGPAGQLPPPVTVGNANAPDFALTFWSSAKAGAYNQGNVTAVITIGANAWTCAAATRQLFMQSFTAFLEAVEALETSGDLVPGAARLVGGRIADWMPAPLAETLFWRYSLSAGTYQNTIPFVDVRPGMRLSVDGEISQFVNPGAPQNAYVAGPQVSFAVGSTGAAGTGAPRLLSFDALLGAIKAPTVAPPSNPQPPQGTSPTATAVAAGAVDLEPTGGTRPYWRLIYPASIPSPLDPGNVEITDNVVLLGAPTIAALEAATAAYPKLDAGGTPANVYLTFLGRALPVPAIPIFLTLRNIPVVEWVPVGTTLANVVERYIPLPLAVPQGSQSNIAVTFNRPTSASPVGGTTVRVDVTLTDAVTKVTLVALPPAIFDLPLIAGDGITLNF
jgi:hypothetical protein